MCGIAGFSGRFEPELLSRMGGLLAHRGPDDHGVFAEPEREIGLAHRRLSIIDLSPLGHQPMADPDGHVALVFNGEIYNYRELRRELEAKGAQFRGHSDTEVILQLYLRDPARFLEKMNGIFAIALWDRRVDTLLLARDGLGVVPLYLARTPRGYLFASEIKAFLAADDLDRSIDHQAMLSYLTYLWSPSPRTAFSSVTKVEPGTVVSLSRGELKSVARFYDLPYGRTRARVSVDAATATVRETIRSAVQRQMVSDVPVGAFLSGGLDSSAVVAFARERSPTLPCFTISLESGAQEAEGFADDLPYAERVARHLGVKLEVVRVGSDMADELPNMVWQLDEPQADFAPLNAMHIAGLAKERGIKVLLSGAGGDDVFTGYRRHLALELERYWSWMPSRIRDNAARAAGSLPSRSALLRRAKRALHAAAGGDDERIERYFEWVPRERAAGLFAADVRAHLTYDGASPLAAILGRAPAGASRLERMLYLEAKHFLADHNLPYTNKMGMAHGVEVRVPLLDREVVAMAAALPDRYKQHGSTGKWIFKRAMEPILPHDVIYRPKTGFGVPLRRWLRGPLAGLTDDMLSAEALRRRGLFDSSAVRRLIEADRAGAQDNSYTVLALLCIELWCRRFVDRSPATP